MTEKKNDLGMMNSTTAAYVSLRNAIDLLDQCILVVNDSLNKGSVPVFSDILVTEVKTSKKTLEIYAETIREFSQKIAIKGVGNEF